LRGLPAGVCDREIDVIVFIAADRTSHPPSGRHGGGLRLVFGRRALLRCIVSR
jgi:hypothetical protein